MIRREQILQRLEARTEIKDLGFVIDGKPSPCFIWAGPDSGTGRGGGYGRMSLHGHTVATHIVAYTNFFGLIPGTKQIGHLCNNRLCRNPAHFEMATHKQNQRRRSQRANSKHNPQE